jgi:hypothetical protein
LAAFTFWYEFYYEIYPHRFQYLWKIRQLHEEYGKSPSPSLDFSFSQYFQALSSVSILYRFISTMQTIWTPSTRPAPTISVTVVAGRITPAPRFGRAPYWKRWITISIGCDEMLYLPSSASVLSRLSKGSS